MWLREQLRPPRKLTLPGGRLRSMTHQRLKVQETGSPVLGSTPQPSASGQGVRGRGGGGGGGRGSSSGGPSRGASGYAEAAGSGMRSMPVASAATSGGNAATSGGNVGGVMADVGLGAHLDHR